MKTFETVLKNIANSYEDRTEAMLKRYTEPLKKEKELWEIYLEQARTYK